MGMEMEMGSIAEWKLVKKIVSSNATDMERGRMGPVGDSSASARAEHGRGFVQEGLALTAFVEVKRLVDRGDISSCTILAHMHHREGERLYQKAIERRLPQAMEILSRFAYHGRHEEFVTHPSVSPRERRREGELDFTFEPQMVRGEIEEKLRILQEVQYGQLGAAGMVSYNRKRSFGVFASAVRSSGLDEERSRELATRTVEEMDAILADISRGLGSLTEFAVVAKRVAQAASARSVQEEASRWDEAFGKSEYASGKSLAYAEAEMGRRMHAKSGLVMDVVMSESVSSSTKSLADIASAEVERVRREFAAVHPGTGRARTPSPEPKPTPHPDEFSRASTGSRVATATEGERSFTAREEERRKASTSPKGTGTSPKGK